MNFAIEVPETSMAALAELAGAAAGARGVARRFVQAEAEQNIITYLEDNGIEVLPIRGVALPADYPAALADAIVDEFDLEDR